jgi:drug/metabolite transporter (DMT)-like permease
LNNSNTDNTPANFFKQYKPELFLLLVAFYWGLSFPLIKTGLLYSSPIFFVFCRFLLCLIIFLIFYRKKLPEIKSQDFSKGIILGILLYVGFVTQTIGLQYTTASNSAFITGINLIFIPFIQIALIKKKPKPENIIGIIIVIVGLFHLSDMNKANINPGDFITLICSVAFAFYIVLLSKYLETINFLVLVLAQFSTMVVLTLTNSVIFEIFILKTFVFETNFSLLFSLIFTGIFSTFFGVFLSIKYQKYVEPVRAGLIYNMEQVFAVIAAFFILKEILSLNQWIGAFLLFFGIFISEFFGKIKNIIKK